MESDCIQVTHSMQGKNIEMTESRNNNEIFENKKINVDLSPRMSVITINVNRLKYTN